jgi:cyclic pyranopterin phosphate synthase
MAKRLSHVDARGRVRMVDVSAKKVTLREAVARGLVWMRRETLERLAAERTPKGNVLATAHLAAVMAAKRTSDLIPLAHPVPIEAVDVAFELDRDGPAVAIEARVRTRGRTGVEMEALTAVAAAALTLYDMLKAVDRGMVIGEIALWEKRGGRSGLWARRSAVPRTESPGAPAPAKRAPARTASARRASSGSASAAPKSPKRAPAARPRRST